MAYGLSLALVHSARVVRTRRAGAKDAQGERVAVEDVGPWFDARRVTRGQPADEGPADAGGARRSEVRYGLMWGDEYEDGSELTEPPTAEAVVEIDLLDGSAPQRYEVTGQPEVFDAGDGPFGGQATIVVVGGAA